MELSSLEYQSQARDASSSLDLTRTETFGGNYHDCHDALRSNGSQYCVPFRGYTLPKNARLTMCISPVDRTIISIEAVLYGTHRVLGPRFSIFLLVYDVRVQLFCRTSAQYDLRLLLSDTTSASQVNCHSVCNFHLTSG